MLTKQELKEMCEAATSRGQSLQTEELMQQGHIAVADFKDMESLTQTGEIIELHEVQCSDGITDFIYYANGAIGGCDCGNDLTIMWFCEEFSDPENFPLIDWLLNRQENEDYEDYLERKEKESE